MVGCPAPRVPEERTDERSFIGLMAGGGGAGARSSQAAARLGYTHPMRRPTALFCASLALGLNLHCAVGPSLDAGLDAGPDRPDAESIFRDAGPPDSGALDGAVTADAGTDAGAPLMDGGLMDGGSDSGMQDASVDGGSSDAGPGVTCPALAPGHTIALDATSDFDKFLPEARVSLGGSVGADDGLVITWDQDYLYGALRSPVFADDSRPLHLYLEVRDALPAAAPAAGKEYDGLTAQLPFAATHLVAIRRVSELGGAGAYNGVYTPAGGWTTVATPLTDGAQVFAEGTGIVAFRVPWTALGCAAAIRLTAHVVNGPVPANEWKDFTPSSTTPWASPGGGYYEIDLTGPPAVTGWTLR